MFLKDLKFMAKNYKQRQTRTIEPRYRYSQRTGKLFIFLTVRDNWIKKIELSRKNYMLPPVSTVFSFSQIFQNGGI